MNIHQRNAERLFGIDWKPADEVGVASLSWRDKAGSRLKRGVEINLCDGRSEGGLRITVSRARARQIAIAILQASGRRFQGYEPLCRRLSKILVLHTVDINTSAAVGTTPIEEIRAAFTDCEVALTKFTETGKRSDERAWKRKGGVLEVVCVGHMRKALDEIEALRALTRNAPPAVDTVATEATNG